MILSYVILAPKRLIKCTTADEMHNCRRGVKMCPRTSKNAIKDTVLCGVMRDYVLQYTQQKTFGIFFGQEKSAGAKMRHYVHFGKNLKYVLDR